MNYQKAQLRIKKLNRQIGQWNRNWLWNFEKIETAKKERRELQAQLPGLKKVQDLIWG